MLICRGALLLSRPIKRRNRKQHEVDAVPEVDKDALCCFGPEVTGGISLGPDGRAEHEIEGEGSGDVVASLWSFHPVLGQLLP